MKVAVCVKHAVDETELRIDASGKPILQGAATKMSTFDKNAVEEALSIKSKLGAEVIVFTVGPAEAKKSIKEALAMGADRAVHVVVDPFAHDPLFTSYLLARAIQAEGTVEVILCSEGSSDSYSGLVPPMLGEWLNLPYVGYAAEISIEGVTATLKRAIEDCIETVQLTLPFVSSVVSEINEPRYPTLIQIMQASRKPMKELTPQQLASSEAPASSVKVIDTKALSMDRKRVIIEGSPEEAAMKLVDALRDEGVISR